MDPESRLAAPARNAIGGILGSFGRIGTRPNDDETTRLRKVLLVAVVILPLPAGLLWGAIYWAFDQPAVAALPWAYVVVALGALAILRRTGNVTRAGRLELLNILVTPFLIMVALGGFVPSSAVIVWAFLAPLGALLFVGPREAVAWLAAYLAMLAEVSRREPIAGRRLELRIGIHSGPVVAGVIGRKRLIYDLWGDAVNVASRMESHGVPGMIHLSRATRDLVAADIECRLRGRMNIKGRGEMETWLLAGPVA